MKHTAKITAILIALFIITQFIGLYVVNHYSQPDNELPYGMKSPEVQKETDFYTSLLPSILIAFVIAVFILFLLTKIKAEIVLKIWFFVVITIALGIALTSFIPDFPNKSLLILIIAIPLTYLKVFKRGFIIHNITELLIYPGIAAVFVPLLNIWTVIILLILISLYDMWAVWKSKIMIKMAKYQMNQVKVFGGFSIPYLSKNVRSKIKKMKKKDLKTKKVRVTLAILGGGDIIFPIIAAGVMLKTFGFIPAILVTAGATLGLVSLYLLADKNKFYPAMPFISAGIFLGMIVGVLI